MTKTSEPFRVPALSEAYEPYADLRQKQADLQSKQAALSVERRKLEKEIAADTSPEVRPAVAELLGDAPGTKALNRRRLAEIRAEHADIDAALTAIVQRLAVARSAASVAVCEAVRPEYARRVAAMVSAARALDAAHRDYDELRFALEAEDVAWGSLTPMTPAFLGSSNEPDRRIARFIREAEVAGYV